MRFWPSTLRAGALAAAFGAATVSATPPAVPAEVKLSARGDGWQLTDERGMSLYVSESDVANSGKSTCDGDCAKTRPPLLAPTDAEVPAGWRVITRSDGARQWAFLGKPVHTFVRDAYAGATFGDGNGWVAAFQPIAVPPGIATARTLIGRVLSTAAGATLYAQTAPQPCTGACLDTWSPVAAPWGVMGAAAEALGEFTAVDRGDGVLQWAFRGQALFTNVADVKAGDINGHKDAGPWRAVVLEPPPPIPDWVQVMGSDAGPLLADPKGMTLYAYDEDRNHLVYVRGEDCFGPCIAESWSPVPADRQVAPIGNWSVVTAADGSLQWSYQGQPLYTSKLETRPGDLTGISPRRARAWRPIMYAIPSIQGASPNG